MEPKKSPKADLTKNSGLYFAIGLALVTLISWRALEWKKYDKSENYGDYSQNVEELLDEEVPLTPDFKTPPPPPPPAAPEIIEVVEDEAEVKETVIESTESSQDKVVEIDDLVVDEVEEDVSIPFAVIEDVPVFPGCEKAKGAAAIRDCFNEQMQKHIRKNFRYPEIAQEMGVQGRVNVIFTIQKDGSIGEIKYRGPDKNLEAEAYRIIKLLPKMTPGKQRGRPVKVPFSIPITFKLQ